MTEISNQICQIRYHYLDQTRHFSHRHLGLSIAVQLYEIHDYETKPVTHNTYYQKTNKSTHEVVKSQHYCQELFVISHMETWKISHLVASTASDRYSLL